MTDFYGGNKLVNREDAEVMLDEYYDERGWEKASSVPTRKKLKELDLEDYAESNRD